MRSRVMHFGALSFATVQSRDDRRLRIGRQLPGKMDNEVVLLFGVEHIYILRARKQDTGVAYLPAALGIERRGLEDQLPGLLTFLFYLPVFDDPGVGLQQLIPQEFG